MTASLLQISWWIQQWKNVENPSTSAKVMGKSIEVPFWLTVYMRRITRHSHSFVYYKLSSYTGRQWCSFRVGGNRYFVPNHSHFNDLTWRCHERHFNPPLLQNCLPSLIYGAGALGSAQNFHFLNFPKRGVSAPWLPLQEPMRVWVGLRRLTHTSSACTPTSSTTSSSRRWRARPSTLWGSTDIAWLDNVRPSSTGGHRET